MHPLDARFLDVLTDGGFIALVTALVPFHQALVELFKRLSKAKARHYYQALAYVVLGPVAPAPALARATRVTLSLFQGAALPPAELGPGSQVRWSRGRQGRLVDSFLLRSVGDDPFEELSDRDVDNVVQIARLEAPADVRETAELLEGLLAGGPGDAREAAAALAGLEVGGEVGKRVQGWVRRLRRAGDGVPVAGLLEGWRRLFLEEFLPGEVRARAELATSFRAAEYRYHRTLTAFSVALAAAEAWVVGSHFAGPLAGDASTIEVRSGLEVFAATALVTFGTLALAPRGTKSLLDAVIGVGGRLKR